MVCGDKTQIRYLSKGIIARSQAIGTWGLWPFHSSVPALWCWTCVISVASGCRDHQVIRLGVNTADGNVRGEMFSRLHTSTAAESTGRLCCKTGTPEIRAKSEHLYLYGQIVLKWNMPPAEHLDGQCYFSFACSTGLAFLILSYSSFSCTQTSV